MTCKIASARSRRSSAAPLLRPSRVRGQSTCFDPHTRAEAEQKVGDGVSCLGNVTVADKSGDAGYAVNAQYYDLIFPKVHFETLGVAMESLLKGCEKVVEIGAGTGQFTKGLIDNLPQNGEIFAIEPSAAMRGALAARLTTLEGEPPVTVLPGDALTLPFDETVDAIVALNVLTHFTPEDREKLWAAWVPRMNPGGVLVVDVQMPQDLTEMPEFTIPGRKLGRRRYDVVAKATVDGDHLVWHMNYRTFEGDKLLSQERVSFPAYVAANDALNKELRGAGCEPVPECPKGVLAWKKCA